MDIHWIKKFRLMVAALILSGSLNIGLLAAFIFSALETKQALPSIAWGPGGQDSLSFSSSYRSELSFMSKLSFAELIAFLTNRDIVGEGLVKRDLAVAALVAFHDFNLEKALASLPAQTRKISLSENREIDLYLGLDDEQFDAIIRFAYREKWPLTPKGLFSLLKKRGSLERDESLMHAFFSTAEFYALQLLFQKTQAPQAPAVLLDLVCEGSWEDLQRFANGQARNLDLSVERRRQLLLDFIGLGSFTGAQLLLQTDFVFARQRLDDEVLLRVIALLKEKTIEADRFCVELLSAPRTDAIWRAASERLYAFAKESPPEPFDLKIALSRFSPKSKAEVSPPLKYAPATLQQHIVKEGESLWKIARQYKVKVDELVKVNELEKDQIHPGMILSIP